MVLSGMTRRFKNLDLYEKLALGLCLAVLCLLLLVGYLHKIGGYGVETDFYGSYAVEAFHLMHGQSYEEPDHGPGYSLALIPFYFLFGDMFSAGKIITILSAVGMGFLSFKVFQKLFDSKLAFFTLVLFFVTIFPYAFLAGNDLFFGFLTILSIYLFYRNGVLSVANLILTGLVAGFAFMTRMNAVILPAAVFVSVLFINPEKWSMANRVKGLSFFALAFMLTASPWLIMNYAKHGNPFATDVYQTVGVGMETSSRIDWAEEKEVIANEHHSLAGVLLTNPVATARFFSKNVLNHFKKLISTLIGFPAYLFLIPGGILLLSQADRRKLSLFTFPLFGFLIYCLLAFIDRFFLYIIFFFLFMVVYFLFQSNWSFRSRKDSIIFARLNQVAFVVTLLLISANTIKATVKEVSNDPVELIRVAERLEDYKGETMIARKPHLGFVSEMKVIYFPQVNTAEELFEYAIENNADLLLYSYIEADLRPQLKVLENPEKVSDHFTLIYHQDEPKIFVYEVNPLSKPKMGTN